MTAKRIVLSATIVAALAFAAGRVVSPVLAGPAGKPPGKPQVKSPREPASMGQQVTLKGRIIDLHGFMTGQFPSADHAKSTADNIRAGVPAAIETPQGIVLLGEGANGAAAKLAPLGMQQAELRGKLYEKHGLKYLEIESAAPMKAGVNNKTHTPTKK